MSALAVLIEHPAIVWGGRIVGLAFLAGVTAAAVAFVYRSRFRDRFPDGATLIVGLGVVAIYLNTRILLIELVVEGGEPFGLGAALGNLAVFFVAGVASLAGRTAGDRLGTDERFRLTGMGNAWSPIVRAGGRFITVSLPEEIDDIEGYDPVAAETKRKLAGLTLQFPRGLTVHEVDRELVERLQEQYDVGYVDVDLGPDGTVEYLGVGQRVAGLGPTLPPGSAAVAIRADPPFSASPGDTVEMWDPSTDEAIGIAELRATAGGTVATVACARGVAARIDPERTYRLMTLAAGAQPDREFATILRRHDTTMGVVEVSSESPLVGRRIGDVAGTVLAVRDSIGTQTIPGRERDISAGDRLFVLARPDELRILEATPGIETMAPEAALDAEGVAIEDAVPRLRDETDRRRIDDAERS